MNTVLFAWSSRLTVLAARVTELTLYKPVRGCNARVNKQFGRCVSTSSPPAIALSIRRDCAPDIIHSGEALLVHDDVKMPVQGFPPTTPTPTSTPAGP